MSSRSPPAKNPQSGSNDPQARPARQVTSTVHQTVLDQTTGLPCHLRPMSRDCQRPSAGVRERTRLSSRPSKEKVMEIGVPFTRIGVSGRSTCSTVFRHLYQFPSLWPCGQRRARSGRLGSHGHRAPSPPSVRIPSETFHWTTNQLTHKGLEQEKLQGLWSSAFGALLQTGSWGVLFYFFILLSTQTLNLQLV